MFWNKVAPIEKRPWKELLRENLNTVVVDVFYSDDPILSLTPEERKIYLKKFKDLVDDVEVINRLKYLVNLQARLTLKGAKDSGESDMAGAMNINGICVVKDDFERLKVMYNKENIGPDKFNRFDVI